MELRTTRVSAGDLTWRIGEVGSEGPPILFLHGFTGDGSFWRPVADALAPRHCIMPDLPGHGGTSAPVPPGAWSLERAAGALADALGRIGIGRYDAVGYSMGGRLALHLALHHPACVERLALVGASCGLDSPAERAERIASDGELASGLENNGIEAFVDRWEALPLFATQKELPEAARHAMRAARLAQDPRALAASLRAFGLGAQEPLGDALAGLAMPVLIVAGELDPKYCRVAEWMGNRIAGARVAIVPGSGHAVPLERPEPFAALLVPFLDPAAQRRDRAHG